jgi:ribosome-binding protein aMBF1 (putative translation factor)
MDLSKQFTDARIKKGLSRKQLAQDMNIKESVVNDIETGVLKHNGMMISKFKKYLGLDNV